jgi:hypothetical protein
MTHVLVIRSARPDVYRHFVERAGDTSLTVLGARIKDDLAAAGHCRIPTRIDAPSGPLSWDRLSPYARVALRNTRWSEIVLLHNLGDESYDPVLRIALRAGALRPLRVFYADGVEHRYPTVLLLALRRLVLSLIASAIVSTLAIAAAGRAALRRRVRRAAVPAP